MEHSLQRLYLLYHELRPVKSRYSYVVTTSEFEKHADLIVRLRNASNLALRPEITFDDGHMSNFEIAAPILQSRKLRAQFFITVGWTGTRPDYMGWAELRELYESGQQIGAHGWTHALLTHCNETELLAELKNARLTLEDKLGTSITTMSLPGGRYNQRVLNACLEAGYRQIYTSVPKPESLPLGTMIGRLNIRGDMQTEWISSLFEANSRVLTSLNRQYRMKAAAKKLLGDRLYEELWARLNRKEPNSMVGEATANEDSAHYQ